MSNSDDRLHEFICLYEAESGETLSLEYTRALASRLVQLYTLLIGPAPGEKDVPEGGNTVAVRLKDEVYN